MNEVDPDELKRAVESQHGGTATLVQSVPVTDTWKRRTESEGITHIRDETVWEGVVHVFNLADHPNAERVYAWSSQRDDGGQRFYAVLHVGPVTGPLEAVRAAMMSERQTEK